MSLLGYNICFIIEKILIYAAYDGYLYYSDARGISSTTLYIILAVAAGIILILLGVVLIVVFRRRDGSASSSPDRSKKGYVKGNVKGCLSFLSHC